MTIAKAFKVSSFKSSIMSRINVFSVSSVADVHSLISPLILENLTDYLFESKFITTKIIIAKINGHLLTWRAGISPLTRPFK